VALPKLQIGLSKSWLLYKQMMQSQYSLKDIQSIELYIDAGNHARKRWKDDMFSDINLVASNASNKQYAKNRERKQIMRVWKYLWYNHGQASCDKFTVYLNKLICCLVFSSLPTYSTWTQNTNKKSN